MISVLLTVLVVIGCVSPAAGQEHFFFVTKPQRVTVHAGEAVCLPCRASQPAGLHYHWTLDGVLLHNSTRVHQMGPDLVIRRVDPLHDMGEFACVATNSSSGFSQTTPSVALTIVWLAQKAEVVLRQPDSAGKLTPGMDMVLVCDVMGSDTISYDWFRNGERVGSTEHVQAKGRRLYLRKVTALDAGVYRCRAFNDAGSTNSSRNFPLVIPDARFPLLAVAPADVVERRGATAHLHCGFRDADFTEWFAHGSQLLTNTSRITVYPNGSLVITAVGSGDEGLYTCVGAKGQQSQSYAVELHIAYLEELTDTSLEPAGAVDGTRVVAEHEQLEATCLAPRGEPAPRVWWRDPHNRTVTDAGAVRVDDGRLLVEAARPDHTGLYTCVVENIAGSRERAFHLLVTVQPRIIQDPQPVIADEEARVIFRCQFDAMKPPLTKVEWLKNGTLVSEEHDHMRVQRGETNTSLIISSTTLGDRGQYSCLLNTTGHQPVVSKYATLLVKEKLKFSPRPVSRKLELGTKTSVYCRAQGFSPPSVKWFKRCQNQQDCKSSLELPYHVEDINGTLEFQNVTLEDRGNYTCVAANVQGVIYATIDIDVIVTPKFRVPPQNVSAYEGYTAMLHCAADGLPQPTIKWDRNSNLSALPSRFEVLPNGSLWIREVLLSDSGRYGCTAGNSGGFKREEVTLIVESSEGYQPSEGTEPSGAMMTKTVSITLGAAAAYMVLVVGLMVWCRRRRRKRKQAALDAPAAEVEKVENGDVVMTDYQICKETRGKSDSKDGQKSDGDTTQSQGSNQSKKSKAGLERFTISRHDLHTTVLLGHGQFGEVLLAQAHGIQESGNVIVLVKALQPTRNDVILQEFKREIDLFSKPAHPNVSRLIGLCREAEPHYMILDYMDWGDLKQFLLATRGGKVASSSVKNRPRPKPLSVVQMTNIALQVAQGMDHLASHRIVHRDLAARNCIIGTGFTVKVSLVALSKDIYSKEYYSHHNQVIPLRWLPAEAVLEDDFSTKSDVFMWAVLVWELFHQGEMPLNKMADDSVLAAMNRHELVHKPPTAASKEFQTFLNCCWAESPRGRPTFSEVVCHLREISEESSVLSQGKQNNSASID